MSDSRDPSDDTERETLADLHREASKAVDERPDPHVRERVLAAARAAEAFNRARDAQEKALRARNAPVAPAGWPKSVAAVLAVAVVTAFLAGRLWPDRSDIDDAASTTVASAPVAAPPPAAASEGPMLASNEIESKTAQARTVPATRSAVDGEAIARERRPDRRAFSRDRDEPVIAAKKAEAEPIAAEASAAPAQRAQADIATAADAPSNDTHMAAAAPPAAAAPLAVAPAPTGEGAMARNAQRAKVDGALGMSALSAAQPSPDAWLQTILQLRRAGNDAAADNEVRRLRQRYPDFPIPAEALAPVARP